MRKKSRWLYLSLIIMAFGYSFHWSLHNLAQRNFMLSEPLDLGEIARLCEIQFPPQAVLEDNVFEGGLHRTLIAKIAMP